MQCGLMLPSVTTGYYYSFYYNVENYDHVIMTVHQLDQLLCGGLFLHPRLGEWIIVMSMSVRPSVLPSIRRSVHVFGTACPCFSVFQIFLGHVTYGHGSVLLWRHCDTLCTYGFMDRIMFEHNNITLRAPAICHPSDRHTRWLDLHSTHVQRPFVRHYPGEPVPIWILLKQETVSGSGISWAICKSAPCTRQMTMPAPYHLVFYRPDALPDAQLTASKH